MKLNPQFDCYSAPGSCEAPRFFDCRITAQPLFPTTLDTRPSTLVEDASPFRYQTKWSLDHGPKKGEHWTIDQYDYGLRMYDAQMGRFISRDPLGEAGGMNLYAAFGNDPVNRYDYLGLFTPDYYEEERQKQEDAMRKECADMGGNFVPPNICNIYTFVMSPFEVSASGDPNFNHMGGVTVGGGYGGGGGSGHGSHGGGGTGGGPGGGSGEEKPNQALQDCLDAAKTAYDRDMGRAAELRDNAIESEFDEIASIRRTAHAQFGANVARVVRDTAISTALGLVSGGYASITYATRATQARSLYSSARSMASVRRLARVASANQLRANYLHTAGGFGGAAAYQFFVAETPGAVGIEITTGIVDELGNTHGTIGFAVGLGLGAYDAYVSSGASPEEAAGIVLHQMGLYNRLHKTVSGRYDAAVGKCHEE